RRRLGTFRGRLRALRRRGEPGQRAVQLDLLTYHLADAPDALADVLLADPGEVQPHRGAATPVDKGGSAGYERHVLLEAAGEQVGRVDVVGQGGPDEQPALRMRPLRFTGELLGQRIEHHVAPAAVDLGQRPVVVRPGGRVGRV